MNVHILATCRNPSLFAATEMVFKTIRVGFPTARISVTCNGLMPTHQKTILRHVFRVGGDVLHVPDRRRLTHWEWIAWLIETRRDPFWICDTDVVFWSSMERFKVHGPMHGRLVPSFRCPVTKASTIERLHTALLHIDPEAFRKFQECHTKEQAAAHPFPLEIDLVKPVRFAVTGKMYFHDTLGQAYSVLNGHHFTEEMLDCYDHISSGTWLDLLDRSVPTSLAQQMDRILHPEKAKGLWRHQQAWMESRPI